MGLGLSGSVWGLCERDRAVLLWGGVGCATRRMGFWGLFRKKYKWHGDSRQGCQPTDRDGDNRSRSHLDLFPPAVPSLGQADVQQGAPRNPRAPQGWRGGRWSAAGGGISRVLRCHLCAWCPWRSQGSLCTPLLCQAQPHQTAPVWSEGRGKRSQRSIIITIITARCKFIVKSLIQTMGPANPFTMGLIANQTDFTLAVPLTMRLRGEGLLGGVRRLCGCSRLPLAPPSPCQALQQGQPPADGHRDGTRVCQVGKASSSR